MIPINGIGHAGYDKTCKGCMYIDKYKCCCKYAHIPLCRVGDSYLRMDLCIIDDTKRISDDEQGSHSK